MKKSIGILLASTIGMGVFANSAIAETKPAGKHRISFEEMDTNGDGFITLEEAEAQRTNRFNSTDANNDGNLSKDELRASIVEKMSKNGRTPNEAKIDKRLDKMFKRLDKDSNGTLSQTEMPSASKRFEKMDANKDGKISKEEAKQAHAKRKGKRKDKRKKNQESE